MMMRKKPKDGNTRKKKSMLGTGSEASKSQKDSKWKIDLGVPRNGIQV